jgi:uncharacterized membrane protein
MSAVAVSAGASRRPTLRAATVVVALIGLGIATYLTIVHYAGGAPVCAIAHGCDTVQKSRYAEFAGVPVAVLGLLGYVGILASLVKDTEASRTVTAFIAIAGLAFSGYLTYLELFTIHAICIWCVGSALCMLALTGLSVTRLLRSPVPAR